MRYRTCKSWANTTTAENRNPPLQVSGFIRSLPWAVPRARTGKRCLVLYVESAELTIREHHTDQAQLD